MYCTHLNTHSFLTFYICIHIAWWWCAHFILLYFYSCVQCAVSNKHYCSSFVWIATMTGSESVWVNECVCMFYACVLNEHIYIYTTRQLAWQRRPYVLYVTRCCLCICFLAVLDMKWYDVDCNIIILYLHEYWWKNSVELKSNLMEFQF